LHLSVIVREGIDDTTLRRAAGHVPVTALPGEAGNFVVLGHRDTLFRPLRGLEVGDRVRVRTADGEFNYGVDSIGVVLPENVDLSESSGAGMTLVTCFPFDFIGPAPRRFVARGHLEER
jgi:sortase A